MSLTFIIGNPHKAAYVATWCEAPIAHKRLELDEIQALDLRTIVEHKARQAFDILQTPVLVEDVSLEIAALGRLPGPFIKWFIEELSNDGLCALLPAGADRRATARICYALYDGGGGATVKFFEGSMRGVIAEAPRGDNGFGWDAIFIKEGMEFTRAELDVATEAQTSMRRQPLRQIKTYIHEFKI